MRYLIPANKLSEITIEREDVEKAIYSLNKKLIKAKKDNRPYSILYMDAVFD